MRNTAGCLLIASDKHGCHGCWVARRPRPFKCLDDLLIISEVTEEVRREEDTCFILQFL